MSGLQQSVGKLTRRRGESVPHPALAPCQCQATEATGWYINVRTEETGRTQRGVECGKGDGEVGETDEKRMEKKVTIKRRRNGDQCERM